MTNIQEEQEKQLSILNDDTNANYDDANSDGIAEGDFNEDKSQPNKTFFNRFFSEIKPGSLRASIFTLSIVSIGIGCLAIPSVISDISIAFGVVVVILAAIITFWTLDIIIQAGKIKKLSVYSHIIEEYLGRKFSISYDVAMLITLFGVIIIYIYIFYEMLSSFAFTLLSKEDKLLYSNSVLTFQTKSIWGEDYFRAIILSSTVLIMLPLLLLKDVSILNFSTYGSIISLFIGIIVLICQLPDYLHNYNEFLYNKDDTITHINWYDIGKGFNKDFAFFKDVAGVFFSI